MTHPDIEHTFYRTIPAIEIKNDFAQATVLLQGAQVIRFQAHGDEPLLWNNTHVSFETGQPVRQGIPVCWPWFGNFDKNPQTVQDCFKYLDHKGAHGFARNKLWTLSNWFHNSEGTTLICTLDDLPDNFPLKPTLRFLIGKTLQLTLSTQNHASETVHFSQALHTYFSVGDIFSTELLGLEHCAYLDALDQWQKKIQHGPLFFTAETDRVYLNTPDELHIKSKNNNIIHLQTQGSASTVVWNPWLEKSQRMSQMPAEAYRNFLCVESANAASDTVSLEAGQIHTLALVISSTHTDSAKSK